MAQRIGFAEMKAEQAKMTESWKAEGRLSEAWVVADPEIVQSSDRRHRRWPSEIQLERLPRQQSAENHAPLGGRVHPAIFAPRSTESVPPHSLLRVPRESTPQGEVGALSATSRHGSSTGKSC